MKFIIAVVFALALVSGQKGKGGLSNGFPGNSGPNGHGQNHDGTFPGQGNFPGGGLGNGGIFPGGGHGNGNGNGNGNDDHGNGGGNFPGGGHENGNGNGNGNDDHGNGGGHGGLPVPGVQPVTNVGSDGLSLKDAFGKYLVLKALLGQNNDYDYDYAPPKMHRPRNGQCVTGPVLRTMAGRKLLCDFNGACPTGSDCQNGLCCHLTPTLVGRRRRNVWP